MLRSASAFEMYRKRHGRIAPDRIVEFLLLDREFPRAVHYCLIEAEESLHAISGTRRSARSATRPSSASGSSAPSWRTPRCGSIIASGLHEFLDALQTRINLVGRRRSSATFFAPRAQSAAS